MTVSVYGIGWLSPGGYGTVGSRFEHRFAPGETLRTAARAGLFSRTVKNFGRLDDVSRLTLAAVSLALRDGAVDPAPENKLNIGIVGAAAAGSLVTDREYFADYLANGRKLSRANLFIYTLPSSSLGEAAIHFGLTGPLLYLTTVADSLAAAAGTAAGIIAEGGAGMMLAGELWGDEALYLLLGDDSGRPLCTLDEALAVTVPFAGVAAMVDKLKLISALIQGNL
jgi:3-oxoacyl-[acyl-carrier-protein] synthase II